MTIDEQITHAEGEIAKVMGEVNEIQKRLKELSERLDSLQQAKRLLEIARDGGINIEVARKKQ